MNPKAEELEKIKKNEKYKESIDYINAMHKKFPHLECSYQIRKLNSREFNGECVVCRYDSEMLKKMPQNERHAFTKLLMYNLHRELPVGSASGLEIYQFSMTKQISGVFKQNSKKPTPEEQVDEVVRLIAPEYKEQDANETQLKMG